MKIPVKIFIISALLICLGLSAYSSYNINIYYIEFSESHSSSNNCLVSDEESLTDDQISQTAKYSLLTDSNWFTLNLQNTSLSPLSYDPIWQPPKI